MNKYLITIYSYVNNKIGKVIETIQYTANNEKEAFDYAYHTEKVIELTRLNPYQPEYMVNVKQVKSFE